jgi:hypothetical protein
MNLNMLFGLTVWNSAFEASPAGGDVPSLGDDKIREVKSAIRERIAKEHKMDLATGTASADGWHIQGSAVDYYQSSAPTTRPDGVTALDVNDYGRRWTHSVTLVQSVYTSTGWVAINYIYTQFEARTDDPATPAVGRVWFRTDL